MRDDLEIAFGDSQVGSQNHTSQAQNSKNEHMTSRDLNLCCFAACAMQHNINAALRNFFEGLCRGSEVQMDFG
jgi:hypothetical protein